MKPKIFFTKVVICLALSCGSRLAFAQTDFWQQTNGPFGGDVRALAVNANGDVFAGTYGSGIFRSTDNGENWIPSNAGLTIPTVLSLAVNKSTGDLFAGTGFLFFNAWSNGAIFHSTDNGTSWTKVIELNDTAVSSLAIDSQGNIFAGTNGKGVFRSITNGASWDSVNAGLTQEAFRKINALAIRQSTGEVFVGTDSSGLFRLSADSSTWERVTIGLRPDENIRSLVVKDDGHIFAGTQHPAGFGFLLGGRIFRSVDGITWNEASNGLAGREIVALAANSQGDIFAGTESLFSSAIGRIFRSTDNGDNWTEPDPSFRNPGVRSLAVNSRDEVFAGTIGGGVLRSKDAGESWQAANNGLVRVPIPAMAINSNGQIFAGSSGAGMFRLADAAASWKPINSGLGNFQVTALGINSNNQIFAGTAYGGVFRSDNNGDSWQPRNTGVTGPGVFSLALRSNGDIFAGTGNALTAKSGGVFRSTDQGENWTRVLNLPDNLVLAFAINMNGQILAGTNGAGIFRASEQDTIWNPVNSGLTNGDVRALAINPATGDIFAGTFGGGVFRSTDHGDTWTEANAGLTNKNIRALAISANGVILAGTWGAGIFRSIDGGNNWNALNSGLTNLHVMSLAIDSSGYVFAGTDGAGVFRSLESTIVPAPTVPTLAAPADSAVNQPPILTLRWNAAAAAETYRLQVANSPDFATTVVDDSTITTTFRQVGPLAFNTTYHWRVNAKNVQGTSAWSEIRRFTTVAQLTSREVRALNTSAAPGAVVDIPIQLLAQGDENALGFSLNFDPTILSNPQARLGKDAGSAALNTNARQAGSGRFGIALALPAGQTFAAGTREIVVVSFAVNANPTADSTRIEFGGQPIAQEVVDANSNTLAATWTGGRVTIARGFEADVAPRPNGNGSVTIADWVQVGRFAAGLDTARVDVNEFQRADCAPRSDRGNGSLSIADWVQAGCYAAGLDTVVAAGGPTNPTTALALGQNAHAAASKVNLRAASSRTVRALNTNFAPGQTDSLTIEFEAEGDENALGFSLSFDAGLLAFKNAVVAGGASGATLNVNTNQSANGRVGVALALPAGQTFSAGNHAIVIAIFSASSSPSVDSTTIEFGDQPVAKEIVDANANTLEASWIPARVTIGMISSVKNITDEVPSSFELGANHPNPFNPSTTITYALPRAVEVKLVIFDLMGRRVRTLVEQTQPAGRYAVIWDGRNEHGEPVASGTFIYQLHAGSFVQNRKMALVR
jgi:ligand-binding sensor domain-containing protein